MSPLAVSTTFARLHLQKGGFITIYYKSGWDPLMETGKSHVGVLKYFKVAQKLNSYILWYILFKKKRQGISSWHFREFSKETFKNDNFLHLAQEVPSVSFLHPHSLETSRALSLLSPTIMPDPVCLRLKSGKKETHSQVLNEAKSLSGGIWSCRSNC